MATLYVENVPDGVYEALRQQAKRHRKSIAAEVIELLEHNVPTEEALRRRQQAFERLRELSLKEPPGKGPFQSSEEMQREDRER